MTIGDQVIVTNCPDLYGIGVIDHVTKGGRLAVMFTDGTEQEFAADELELFAVWVQQQHAPDADLGPLKTLALEPRCTCGHVAVKHEMRPESFDFGVCEDKTHAGNECPCVGYLPLAMPPSKPTERADLPWTGI